LQNFVEKYGIKKLEELMRAHLIKHEISELQKTGKQRVG